MNNNSANIVISIIRNNKTGVDVPCETKKSTFILS